jgi:kynurenine formamidase
MTSHELPVYEALRTRADAPRGTAWGVFGAADEVGTLNLLDSGRVQAGVAEVQAGQVFSLNWRIDLPYPHPHRPTPSRTQTGQGFSRDDYLTPFYLQYSSQWDGLRHFALPEGFYNGITSDRVDDPASSTLGIHLWAERGIVGRGILLDVAGARADMGQPIDPTTGFRITTEMLDETVEAGGVSVEAGDILLLRTGWVGWYSSLGASDREAAFQPSSPQPGLAPTEDVAAWLWDHRIAAIAADNLAVEAAPYDLTPENFLHFRLIPGFGMAMGELFWLDDLARACAADQRWSFLFTSAPLNVLGGVGSPPNALAIR